MTSGIVPAAAIAIVLYSMKPEEERLLDVDMPLAGQFAEDQDEVEGRPGTPRRSTTEEDDR